MQAFTSTSVIATESFTYPGAENLARTNEGIVSYVTVGRSLYDQFSGLINYPLHVRVSQMALQKLASMVRYLECPLPNIELTMHLNSGEAIPWLCIDHFFFDRILKKYLLGQTKSHIEEAVPVQKYDTAKKAYAWPMNSERLLLKQMQSSSFISGAIVTHFTASYHLKLRSVVSLGQPFALRFYDTAELSEELIFCLDVSEFDVWQLHLLQRKSDIVLCSYTNQIMREPVTASDGYNYERDAITHWLQTHPYLSDAKKTELLAQLKSNLPLKEAITYYRHRKNI